jgi:hypothetical protein
MNEQWQHQKMNPKHCLYQGICVACTYEIFVVGFYVNITVCGSIIESMWVGTQKIEMPSELSELCGGACQLTTSRGRLPADAAHLDLLLA